MKDFFAQLGRLLRFELRKLTHRKTLYIASAITFIAAFSLVSATVENLLYEEMDFMVSSLTFGQMLASAMSSVSGETGEIMFLGAIVVGLVFCDDYSGGTIKLIVSRGYSKVAIYTAKAVNILICAFTMSFIAPLVGAFLGCAVNGVNLSLGGFGDAASEYGLFASLAMSIAALFIFMLIGVLVKKSGAVIAIGVGGIYLSQILILIIELFLDMGGMEYEEILKVITNLKNYFPLFYNTGITIYGYESVSMAGAYIGAAAWIVIAAALGALVAHKRDC